MKKINLKKVLIIFVLIFFIFPLLANLIFSKKFSGFLLYHKPAFRGKVIDAETKEPIVSAVVVAVYNKKDIGLIESYTNVVKVKETLTDENGKFFFPAFTTIIQPFSYEVYLEFIIYKPGYGNFPRNRISPPSGISVITGENYFLAENFWKKGKVEVLEYGKRRNSLRKVTFGLVELPPMKTREERLNAIPSAPTDFRSKELPLLFKAINEDRKRFGLKPIGGAVKRH